MTDEEWRGGLAPHYDYMLAERPDDPEMRESAPASFSTVAYATADTPSDERDGRWKSP